MVQVSVPALQRLANGKGHSLYLITQGMKGWGEGGIAFDLVGLGKLNTGRTN